MTKNVNFELLETTGNKAVSTLLELRGQLPASRRYPFIIGEKRSFELLTDIYQADENRVSEIIEKSKSLNAQEMFANRKNQALPVDKEFDRESFIKQLTGVWEYQDSALEIGLPWEDLLLSDKNTASRNFLEKCWLGIAPTDESWQVPAFAQFGGWNSCPPPEEHCAILRYWQEKYGAEIVSLTHDVIECSVENPPQTEAECWELAWEQYAYCSDIVDQGVGKVGKLASGLRNSDYWYFWWD